VEDPLRKERSNEVYQKEVRSGKSYGSNRFLGDFIKRDSEGRGRNQSGLVSKGGYRNLFGH